MSWEVRGKGKHRYYYRCRRRPNGGIERIYLGRGAIAEQAARRDMEARDGRGKDREEARRLQATLAPLDRLFKDLDEGVQILTRATLLVGNFHQHKGQWRLKHGR